MIDQIVIAAFGLTAVWLSQDTRRSTQRWACIVGLIAQPAWWYATWRAEQWGMFATSIIYTFGWLRGVRNFWLLRSAHG